MLAAVLFGIAVLIAWWGVKWLATMWGFGYRDSSDSAYVGGASTAFSMSCLMLMISLLALPGRRWRYRNVILGALLVLSGGFLAVAASAVLAGGWGLPFAVVLYAIATSFIVIGIIVAGHRWKK